MEIQVNKDGSVKKSDWPKVEKLPFGGVYGNKASGFNDHITPCGKIIRVYFPTWSSAKKVVVQ